MANTEGSEVIEQIPSTSAVHRVLGARIRGQSMSSHVEQVREKINDIERQLRELKEML